MTVFNFVLPPGTVLSDKRTSSRQSLKQGKGRPAAAAQHERTRRSGPQRQVVPEDEAVDSLNGLAGLDGSTVSNGITLYYTAMVYSEETNGRVNGIVAFDESWKNVAATLYHELNEARTDPDVALVIAGGPDSLLGWISQQGDECGDRPVETADPLSQVLQDVPLVAGGTAPVQFLYSNRVHGAEAPASLPSRPTTERPGMPKVGAALRAAIEATLGSAGPGRHDQSHSSESYGVCVHYQSP